MLVNEKKVYVYENWTSDSPRKLGCLYIDRIRGEEIYSFEYDRNHLTDAYDIFLDPEIHFVTGRQYTMKKLFGMFQDSSPDRWGRMLLYRWESRRSRDENRRQGIGTQLMKEMLDLLRSQGYRKASLAV